MILLCMPHFLFHCRENAEEPPLQTISEIKVRNLNSEESRSYVIPNNLSSVLNLELDPDSGPDADLNLDPEEGTSCVLLQAELTVESKDLSLPFALDAGRLSDVSRIYLNGTLIAQRGSLQPYRSGAFRPQLISVPRDILQPGKNELRIQLCNYKSLYPLQIMDPLQFGPASKVWQKRTFAEILAFAFLSFYLMAAIQHLWLGIRRPGNRYHLPFSGFLFVVSAYWFVAETYSRDAIFGDLVLWHRKSEYILLFFIVPLFLLFLSRFSSERSERVARISLLVAAALSLVSLPSDINIVRICGWIWQIGFLGLSPYLAYLAYAQLLRPSPLSRLMTGAVMLLLLSTIHDILVSLSILHSPRIASYSLALLVIGLILILGDQLVQATNRSEKLLSHATRLNLEMLKKNIHPHFLANSLNSAIELVHENPQRAEKLLLALVEELRSTIELSEQPLCPLETEIQLCRNHIEVMSLRMEKNLTLEVVGKLEGKIPPLILLTIVENGITHGFTNRPEGRFIINVRNHENETFISVENDGDAPGHPEDFRAHSGNYDYSTGTHDMDDPAGDPQLPGASHAPGDSQFYHNDSPKGRGTGTRYILSRLQELCSEWGMYQESTENGFRVLLHYRLSPDRTRG